MSAAEVPAACDWPHKTPYENRAAADAALRRMDAGKKKGVHVYPCPGGRHWHLGKRLKPGLAGGKRRGDRR